MPTHQTKYIYTPREGTDAQIMFAPGFGTIFVQYKFSRDENEHWTGSSTLKTIAGKCPGLEKTLFDTELPLLPPTAHHTHKAAYYAPLVQIPTYE